MDQKFNEIFKTCQEHYNNRNYQKALELGLQLVKSNVSNEYLYQMITNIYYINKDYNNAMKVEHLLIKYDITSHTFRILKKELKLERPRISRAQRIFKTNCVYTCNNINIPAKEVENKSIPQVIPPQPSQAIVQPTIDTVISEVKKKVKNNLTIKWPKSNQ